MGLGWISLGLAIFATLFLLEFIDRTNLVVVSLAAKHRPWDVWAGASLGFLLSTGIAVAIGALFLAVLEPDLFYVRLAGGLLVALYGAWSLHRVERGEGSPAPPVPGQSTVLQVFLLIALLEMGDGTQIVTLLFVATVGNPLLVFVAAALALSCTAAVGTRTGAFLRDRFSRPAVERASSALIIAMGIALVILAFCASG